MYQVQQPRLCFYKPTRENSGSAVQFDLAADKQCVFLEASLQNGPQSFNWQEKLVVKLDPVDLGKLLAVLNGACKQTKIFHDPSKREGYSGSALNNTIEFSRGMQYGFFMRVSQQSADRTVKSVSLGLSDDEAQVTRVLLERAVQRIYSW